MQWPVLSSWRLAIQMDVKFLTFNGKSAKKIRRFQYTAIDDATRIRALKVYERHTQANAIDFVEHVIGTFPFRIREIRTDNRHEFQAKFHWHVEERVSGMPISNRVRSPVEWQGRAVAQIRRAGILSATQL